MRRRRLEDSEHTGSESRAAIKGSALVISGVSLDSISYGPNSSGPRPDYLVLRQMLLPYVIDATTVASPDKRFVRACISLMGRPWTIAFLARLRAHRYTVIVATGEDVGLRFALLNGITRPTVPLVMICHNIATRRPAFYLKTLRAARTVSRFLCLSEAQADILVGRYGVPRQQVRVINWFVDAEFFHPTPAVQGKQQICSAGMASRDYATLVEATRDCDVEIKIAADSPWFRQSLNIVTGSLPPHVEARSFGTYEALRELYSESLFVVVPLMDVEFSAGYSVILEAMAMGKAVIVTEIRQKDDFIVDGWNGFHVAPGDAAQLRDRIEFLLQRPDEAIRMGINGRKLVEDRFTLSHYGEVISDVVSTVLHLNRA